MVSCSWNQFIESKELVDLVMQGEVARACITRHTHIYIYVHTVNGVGL